jgi:hypothetical protein
MTEAPWTETERRALARAALALVETCVRNTKIEDWHAGREVISPAGDFSDVKIVTPTGEIPYLEASRISDPEMKAWMIEVTNRVFTFLSFPDQPIQLGGAAGWNMPKLDEKMAQGIRNRIAIRDGADPAAIYGGRPLDQD